MNLEINQTVIVEALEGVLRKSLSGCISRMAMDDAVQRAVSAEIATGVMVQAVEDAVASLDTDGLTRALAAEIQRATTAVVIGILREGLVDVVAKIRGVGNWTGGDKAARARIKEELWGRR